VPKYKSEFAGFSEFAEWLDQDLLIFQDADQDYQGFSAQEILKILTF
jgi:hypothetical protein